MLRIQILFCVSLDYRVGSSDGWSALYNFNATKAGTAWQPRFAIYGDLGVDNAQSLSKLQKEVQGGQYDAILHVGMDIYIHTKLHIATNVKRRKKTGHRIKPRVFSDI